MRTRGWVACFCEVNAFSETLTSLAAGSDVMEPCNSHVTLTMLGQRTKPT